MLIVAVPCCFADISIAPEQKQEKVHSDSNAVSDNIKMDLV